MDVAPHLKTTYGVTVSELLPLDLNVWRVARSDGPDWVARVFPAPRPRAAAEADAAVLAWLADRGYPAERPATTTPVSEFDATTLLVTEYLPSVPPDGRREAIRRAGGFRRLGELLAELHSLPAPAAALHPGGAWHHAAEGGPVAEVRAALAWLEAPPLAPLRATFCPPLEAALASLAATLPQALLHPDFCFANVVVTPTPAPMLHLVDWTGAGWGPRVWSLAWLLFTAAAVDPSLKRLDLALSGYRSQIALAPQEAPALRALLPVRPLLLEAWKVRHGRSGPPEALRNAAGGLRTCEAILARARARRC